MLHRCYKKLSLLSTNYNLIYFLPCFTVPKCTFPVCVVTFYVKKIKKMYLSLKISRGFLFSSVRVPRPNLFSSDLNTRVVQPAPDTAGWTSHSFLGIFDRNNCLPICRKSKHLSAYYLNPEFLCTP